MEFYTKETIKALHDKIDESTYYFPKVLFEGKAFGVVRLETKLAYTAILDTLIKKAAYTKEGIAMVKTDNPEVIRTLAIIANKEVNQEKMDMYLEELNNANLIEINKQDVYVTNI